MSPGFTGLAVLMALLTICHAVDIGPVNLHRTRCLSNRFKECEECYTNQRLAMCHRLSLGKFHRLVAYKENRPEDIPSAKKIILEACDYLMDKDVDTDSITCRGFKGLFVNENGGLEPGASPEMNAEGARQTCVKVFIAQGFACAIATVVVTKNADGTAIGIIITVILSPTCQAPISVFNLALNTLRNTAGFAQIFVDTPELDFNPTGNSTLSLPLVID